MKNKLCATAKTFDHDSKSIQAKWCECRLYT